MYCQGESDSNTVRGKTLSERQGGLLVDVHAYANFMGNQEVSDIKEDL